MPRRSHSRLRRSRSRRHRDRSPSPLPRARRSTHSRSPRTNRRHSYHGVADAVPHQHQPPDLTTVDHAAYPEDAQLVNTHPDHTDHQPPLLHLGLCHTTPHIDHVNLITGVHTSFTHPQTSPRTLHHSDHFEAQSPHITINHTQVTTTTMSSTTGAIPPHPTSTRSPHQPTVHLLQTTRTNHTRDHTSGDHQHTAVTPIQLPTHGLPY